MLLVSDFTFIANSLHLLQILSSCLTPEYLTNSTGSLWLLSRNKVIFLHNNGFGKYVRYDSKLKLSFYFTIKYTFRALF